MMKKIIIAIACGIAVLLLLVVFVFTQTGKNGMKLGRYNIVDNDKYPDAYLEVTETTLQFFNIDLNEYYQAEQMREYRMVLDNDPEWYGAVSDEELTELTDLNAVYVERAFDYSNCTITKVGTNVYRYFTYYHDNFLGFGTRYNTKTGEIEIKRSDVVLRFEKE